MAAANEVGAAETKYAVCSQLFKSAEKNRCWAEISAVRLDVYGACRRLDRKETNGVVSVCFQRLHQHLSQQRQFVAQSRKMGKSFDFFSYMPS